ncbi:MAG: hypothetical protein ABR530_06510 [Pyrinomonadaceae bacterium]
MAEERTITPEAFRLLLDWLDSDEELAAERYESIRHGLIRVFAGRGCFDAEELADLTIDRVTLKVHNVIGDYTGDPARYFYGVAQNVYLEWLRGHKRSRESEFFVASKSAGNEQRETEYRCLERCLEGLEPKAREIIVDYYRNEKQEKIKGRRRLAADLGITVGALQIKTSRIRERLLACVRKCMDEK